jgi:hypothetical protein
MYSVYCKELAGYLEEPIRIRLLPNHYTVIRDQSYFFLVVGFLLGRGSSGNGTVSIARSESIAAKKRRTYLCILVIGSSGRGTVSIARSESSAEKNLRIRRFIAFGGIELAAFLFGLLISFFMILSLSDL